jgi:hypothetical protein
MKRRVCALASLAAALAALAGCGGGAGDLMSITASGGFAGGMHTTVVSGDGRGSCDRGPLTELPSARVIDAREIARDAAPLARRAASYGPPSPDARSFVLNTKDGVVRWSEGTPGLPSVLPRTQLLAVQLERLLCRP